MPDDDNFSQFDLGFKLTRQLVSSWIPKPKSKSSVPITVLRDRPSGLGLGSNVEKGIKERNIKKNTFQKRKALEVQTNLSSDDDDESRTSIRKKKSKR